MSKKQKKRSVEDLYWVDVHLRALGKRLRQENLRDAREHAWLDHYIGVAEEEAAQEEVASCELTGQQSRDRGRPWRSLVL